MKKLLFALILSSIGLQAQVKSDTTETVSISIVSEPKEAHINHHFWDAGIGVQRESTVLSANYSYRAKKWMVRTGLVGSIFGLSGTIANEYNAQVRLGVDYHFLNYGFLNSWSNSKKQYRWTPYAHVGVLSGVRYIQNYDQIIYETHDRWNYLQSLEAAIGVKYSPKDILGWHTSGWLTFVGAVGVVSNNLDGNFTSFHLGINYIIGY